MNWLVSNRMKSPTNYFYSYNLTIVLFRSYHFAVKTKSSENRIGRIRAKTT